MDMDDALQTFFVESRELLESMEQCLLKIEQTPDDVELINAIFRTAHTIKGSAGLFGLDDIVSFTHVAESVLDCLRDGEISIDAELIALLLSAGDHIYTLVDHAAVNGGELTEEMSSNGARLNKALSAYLLLSEHGSKAEINGEPSGQKQAQSNALAEHNHPYTTEGGGAVETDLWHLSLRFGLEVLRNGTDPISFIRYLGTLGSIEHIVTLVDNLPALAEFNAESCYLGFEIGFKSEADKATIEGVFDFVREYSEIRILPPNSKIADYLKLIEALPGEDLKIGEILLSCGTLTERELSQILALQQSDKRLMGELLVDAQMVPQPVIEAALSKQKTNKEAKNSEANLIRVDADKLDDLINLVGELIVAGAGANLLANNTGVTPLIEATATVSMLVEQLRDSALSMRMVQIGGTFNRFQRVVRDVSKTLGKDMELIINGAETELDKTVVEKIGDPLTHLVRNAMDHGIEQADVRLALGKPAKGTLTLNAFHDAGSIVIEVSDDGGGLNKEKILSKAIERGLASEGQNLSDKEIFNLIFEAGFSTAETVSNLSGRGVGMDVVKRNIQALRGSVVIDSIEGQGSKVSIRLPLTLAIIDGFLVGVGDSAYVIPLDMVVECIEMDAWNQDGGVGHYLNLRGEVLPYCRLREHFEVESAATNRENVVVVRFGDAKVGLVVDKLMGEFQTVIKPLGKVFSQMRGVGGFTILGSGEVALILDVPSLIKQVSQHYEHLKSVH